MHLVHFLQWMLCIYLTRDSVAISIITVTSMVGTIIVTPDSATLVVLSQERSKNCLPSDCSTRALLSVERQDLLQGN